MYINLEWLIIIFLVGMIIGMSIRRPSRLL
jgi:hypothetical protein